MKAIALITFALLVVVASAAMSPVTNAAEFCQRIGTFSGCSGCAIGSGGTCDWCVDPADESGKNIKLNVKSPLCVPKNGCPALGGGRVKATADLCPVLPVNQTEAHYEGPKMEETSSVIFSSAHDRFYCDFSRLPWVVDRTALGNVGGCNDVNTHQLAGVGAELGMIAGRCFGNVSVLTYRMKECLKEVQAFACTYQCREYGVATIGYKKSTCDRFRNVCGSYMGNAKCALTRFSGILDVYCAADDAPRTTSATAIRPTSRWEYDYGVDHKYDLPVDCKLSEWSDWSACSELCNTGSQFRTKSVTVPAAHGGDPCTGSQYETQVCNTMACVCNYFPASWSTCSNDCGVGTQTRTRNLDSANSVGVCDPTLFQSTACVGNGCCAYSAWVDGTCSGPCGSTGSMTQTRTIVVGDASFCLAPLTQNVACTTAPCASGHFAGSVILNAAQKTQLETWTAATITAAGAGKKWIPCYAAPNTQNAALFRQTCLNKGPTVFVAKEATRNGVYGGFTPLSWTAVPTQQIDKYDLGVFTFRLTDRVDGSTNQFVQCFDDTTTNGRLMIDYYWVGPCLGNDACCVINNVIWFFDGPHDMQVGCAYADGGNIGPLPYQFVEVYYLG